jgi:hypothetical protein
MTCSTDRNLQIKENTMIRETFRHPLDFGTASLEIKKERSGTYVVLAYLPASMEANDAPIIYGRDKNLEVAKAMLPNARADVKKNVRSLTHQWSLRAPWTSRQRKP